MENLNSLAHGNVAPLGRLSQRAKGFVAFLVFVITYVSISETPDASYASSEAHRFLLQDQDVVDPSLIFNNKEGTTTATDINEAHNDVESLQVCGRMTSAPHFKDKQCERNGENILLMDYKSTLGRTGNRIRSFLHAFEIAHSMNLDVGIMKDSWAMKLVTEMWWAIQDSNEWKKQFEDAFCVKIFENKEELNGWNITRMTAKDLFYNDVKYDNISDKIEIQDDIIQTLFRSYNKGNGKDIKNEDVNDMCTVVDGVLGEEKSSVYSVIHSRTLESMGKGLLQRTSESTGCDPVAALLMEPDYVKSILAPIGMLDHPIIFISDGENPQVLQRLLEDPDIGPLIRAAPEESSWLGGDITAAIMSDAFIGNPASSFSAFIAKSRVAFGFNNTYLFRARDENGGWKDVCDENCFYGPRFG